MYKKAQVDNSRYFFSENILQIPEDLSTVHFPSISALICGQMRLNWKDILTLSKIFPSLEELRVQYNMITELEIPDETYFCTLKVLDFEGNNIQNWDEINKLGVLKNLEQLIVTNISITTIKFPVCELGEKLQIFINLRQLVISENLINDVSKILNNPKFNKNI